MNWIRQAIDDGNGNVSSMRLMMVVGCGAVLTVFCGLIVAGSVVSLVQ